MAQFEMRQSSPEEELERNRVMQEELSADVII
jgi:hypothetical protein